MARQVGSSATRTDLTAVSCGWP